VPTCDVWWASPVAPGDAPCLVALLDAHERARLGRLRRPVDAARYLGAHALTRIVLGRRLDRDPAELVFDRTCRCGEPHGKPTLDGGPGFSFTHAGAVVGVAVLSGGPVGLDVEPVRALPDLDSMARHVGAPAEPAAFFRAWTRKEALLKATGDGLTSPMNAIVLDEHGVAEWSGDGAPGGPVWLRDLVAPDGSPAAVAGLGAVTPPVAEHDGHPLLPQA
jgi:4'-phosphopantetheinyl transferase